MLKLRGEGHVQGEVRSTSGVCLEDSQPALTVT